MAEIKIEKKKAIWPWIVGIIILALLIYLLAFNNHDQNKIDETITEEVTSLYVNQATNIGSVYLI